MPGDKGETQEGRRREGEVSVTVVFPRPNNKTSAESVAAPFTECDRRGDRPGQHPLHSAIEE